MSLENAPHDPLADLLALLRKVYPNGLDNRDYKRLLVLLYPHLCDRNLAQLMAQLTHRDADLILNDLYAAVTGQPPPAAELQALQALLERHGARALLTDD
ncbi:hypothetical protein ABFV58_10715 [Pseudomonas protegens]|uniref:hypothetical protein n=1 Tax=Pseudomonas protegens TaxID=380021 RepID=UPI0034D6FDA7